MSLSPGNKSDYSFNFYLQKGFAQWEPSLRDFRPIKQERAGGNRIPFMNKELTNFWELLLGSLALVLRQCRRRQEENKKQKKTLLGKKSFH